MKELNKKEIKLISGGSSENDLFAYVACGVVITSLTLFATWVTATLQGERDARDRLKAEKASKGFHITYMDSELEAELAAINHHNCHHGDAYIAYTYDQFGRSGAS